MIQHYQGTIVMRFSKDALRIFHRRRGKITHRLFDADKVRVAPAASSTHSPAYAESFLRFAKHILRHAVMVRQCYDIQTRVTAQFHGFLSGIAAVAVAAVQVQIRLIPGGRFRFHGDADGNLRLLLHGGYGQRDAPPPGSMGAA